ncbi:dTDP-4-dehydrorhamnose 3,5-epimerase [Loktanella sp. S4079]|uniref:dTDP-4-dehydrorhamnose 3,5-epimerase n=1 Tax=Loktanella sp. S4079 TaxID=579483 RepID=UPI0005F9CF1C|nr:dTDP-4-dehydrorhamnose 3,5-epimerase [Loktanella sp. S4079]KJZ18638.1 dTDP-4-dehydrorhamnose 3,5-epimerase [Loktanella sp. S4079]
MEFTPTSIPDVLKVTPEPHHDMRGHFARTYCGQQFKEMGLEQPIAQMALSHNTKRGTLRGLHFIPEAYGEAKLVRCVRGAIFDVAVDLRPGSETYRQWTGIELSAANMGALYIPRGVAHGFVTLSDNTDILYQFSAPHRPGIEVGIAWDDPQIAVQWPIEPTVISERDTALPKLSHIEPIS